MKWQVNLLADPKTRKGEVDIYDVVGDPWMGTDARNILWQLRTMDVDTLTVRVNSVGGAVSAGMDIHNIIKEHPAANKVARISGCCASIATVIALACDTVEMHANSQWMVHEARAAFDGFGSPPMLAEDLERMAGLLRKTNEQMLAIYAKKTGKSTKTLIETCAAETWFTAEEAKEFGFVDRVIDLDDESSMLLAASAWTPEVSGQFKKFPRALAHLAMVAQGKRPAVQVTAAVAAPGDDEEETMRKKIKAAASEFQKKLEAVTKEFSEISAAAESALEASGEPTQVASADVQAKSKDVEKMEKELKALAKRAKDAEKELESLSSTAEEYAATKERCEKAEAELGDLKKKLEEARASDDGEGDDEDDDDGDEDEDPKAKALFSTLTRAQTRSIIRAAIAATGVVSSAESLELAVMKLTKGVTATVNERDVRIAFVDKLIKDHKITPAQRAWAIKTSKKNLDEYLADMGGQPVVAGEVAQDAAVAAATQGVTTTAQVTLTAEEKKLCAQSGITEERWLEEKKKFAVAAN